MKKESTRVVKTDAAGKQTVGDDREYLEIRIPKITFRNTPINAFLVCILIIFSFLLGMFTNKVIFLEKQIKLVAANPTPANNQVEAAQIQPTLPEVVAVGNGKLPILGDSNAKITIVEFSDLQCPFCKRYVDDTAQQIYDTYIKTGKAKFAYRHFPLSSIHPNSQKASEATECANDQGKFWDYHDLLFQNQSTWSSQTADEAENSFTDYAGKLDLDTQQFRTCLDTDKFKKNVTDDLADGETVQVSGTPAFFINGHRIDGAVPFSELKKIIDQELQKS
jgi:protein-disulfide isomerase